ncbi:unnamed protein product [Chrysoparadoxa australica]
MRFFVAAAILATATAFVAPTAPVGAATRLFAGGKYDGQEWNDEAKKDVLSMYNPDEPWSETNFDPYKKNKDGNACDPSGYYPGDGKYKDPIRPTTSFEEYLKQRAAKEGN